MAWASSYFRGLLAELLAISALFLKGYRIRAWRYKTPVGEVDIIATRGDVLAFVEVKLRPSAEEALSAVTPAMRRRIGAAARHFLARHDGRMAGNPRFDLMAVSGFSIRHLDNAWNDPT